MAYDIALAVFVVGVNLSLSYCDPTINGGDISLRKVCRRKCPAGYFSHCTQEGASRCASCERGVTYSMHRSRSTLCRPCSRCRDNEFEAEPCTPKKDVVCQKCFDCPPGFGVRSFCERKLDTVCELCPVGTVSDEYSAVKKCQPCPVCKERKRHGGDGERREHSEPKNGTKGNFHVSLTSEDQNRSQPVGESNEPWTDDSKQARRHAVVQNPANTTSLKPNSVPSKTAETKMRDGNLHLSDTREEESTEYQATLQKASVQMQVPTSAITSKSMSIASWFIGVIVAILVLFTGSGVFIFHLKKRKNCPANGTRGNTHLRCPHSSDCCDDNSIASLPENEVPNSTSDTETEDTVTSNPTLHTIVTFDSRHVTADIHEPNKRSLFHVFGIDREKQTSSLASNPDPKETFTAHAQDQFDSTGGSLQSPDSNVSIIVPPGAVPNGVSQPIFFGVVFDEKPLLENIPETTSDRTLISPVIKCGPSDLTVLKPVEIVLPHSLCIEDIKKAPVNVFRCGKFSDKGPIWESVPSATKKNSQSMAWFTVKKDTIHIRTKCFSFWSVFACGGPKRKRAAVFASRPSLESNIIYLRFYIYSDTADAFRKVVKQDQHSFPDSKCCTKEKPFKMHNDSKDIEVKLTDLEEGWTFDKTREWQVYHYQSAYNNGDFRVRDSCDFAVKPTRDKVDPFSCLLKFQQEGHPPEHDIYLNTGMRPGCAFQNNNNGSSMASSDETTVNESTDNSTNSQQAVPRVRFQLDFPDEGSENEPVTEGHCHCVAEKVDVHWKKLLRELRMEDSTIRTVDEENREVAEKCFQGLIKWKNCLGSDATTRRLCQALQNIGRRDVINVLVAEGLQAEPGTATQESRACTNTTVCSAKSLLLDKS